MTLTDAAGLALLALHDRRLVAALLRTHSNQSTAEDLEALPPRVANEPMLVWACRCRAPLFADWEGEVARITRVANAQIANAEERGIIPIAFGDDRYPRLLAAIGDPPPMIWLRGEPSVFMDIAIGVVGSRAATPYALEVSRQIALDLTSAGMVVVSGLARGVDSAAHRAVVAARGRTIGVLGCGVDRIYPAEHKDLARKMEEGGAVLSEFPPGVAPLPHHFPQRNRLISGLSLAVVVVEAPERSGSLITASAAAEQGREVMVVPGPVTGGRNRGGHLLIRDGARVIESADDILQELNLPRAGTASRATGAALAAVEDFTVDELAARTGERPHVVLARLLDLELAGQIQRIGGGRFCRVLT